MAVWCGRHVWPDANHRTAFNIFDFASKRAYGRVVMLEGAPSRAAVARRLTEESKSIRDADYRERGHYYTVQELADPTHPYRRTSLDTNR